MTRDPVVHAAPDRLDDPTPCCDHTRFELSWSDGLSKDRAKVTCRAKERPPCTATIRDQNQGLVTCAFNVGHWDEYGPAHGGPRGVGGRFRWTDSAPGATPHQSEHPNPPEGAA
jgi:hypothetical protein